MKHACICLIIGSLSFAAAQEFPIAAFHVDDTTWYQGAGEDSLGLNHIWIGGEKRYDSLKIRQLELANVAGLKGTLYNAVRGDQSNDTVWNSNEIEWYVRLFWTNWEVDSSNFLQYRGTRVRDSQAQGNDAWRVHVDGDTPGLMIEGPKRATSTRLATTYDVHFLVKVDSLGADSIRVCSLWVRADGDHRKDSVVTVADFESTNVYEDIVLSYENQANTLIDYGIYWYGTRNLWVDYIETKDGYVQDVIVNGVYNDTLVSIVSRYNSYPALEYYYLLDEPDIGSFAANRYIMDFLNSHGYKPGIQTVLYRDSAFYETYIDSVKPDSSALLINSYPLQGDWCEQPTPEDSGEIFQGRLDFLCDNLNTARRAAKQDSIPFWFMCQSFGQYLGDSTAYLREPTPRELRCMIWLALAYGAKGIEHFTYRTIPESVWVDSGLTCSGAPRYPLWTAAKEMNFVLRDIGSTLLTLESDTVFKTNTVPPTNCFINEVSDTLIQIGTFHDTLSDYFIIVNRSCFAGVYNVAVSVSSPAPLYLWDCLSEEVIPCTHKPDPGDLWEFVITLFPGQGRLLRLVVDETPPASPYAFSQKSDSNLVLTWNKVMTDTLGNQETMDYYVVYRDTAPSFIPDSLDSIGYTMHPETTYTDSNALNSSDCYYYLVKAVDAAQNTSRKSNMGYKLSKFFNANFWTTDRNWVSLPWHCNYDSVPDLTDDLSPAGDPLTKITNLRDDQLYESWLWDPDFAEWYGTDFAITSGRGYEMITTKDTSLFLVGSNNPNGLVTLNENPSTTDRNWVSIPYNAMYNTVQDITEEYSPSGYPLIKITNLRNDQLYENWLWDDEFPNEGWYGTNFTIERGRGYEFVTTVDTTWNPTEYSNESEGLCWARPKDRKSYGGTSVGSSCVPDRAPAWVYNTAGDTRVINRDIQHAAYHCPDLYTPNKVIAENIVSVHRGTGYSSTSGTRAAAQKGGSQIDEQEKISHVVRAHILDASVYEAVVFTAYCLDRPKDVLTEQMVGSAVVQNNDVAAVWFDAGNFQVPWKEGEEAVFIVEAIKDGKPYIDIENFKLDETVDIQELGIIKFEPSFNSGSQGHAQSLLTFKSTNDNVISYSLYKNGKRLNERVLQDEHSIPAHVSVKLVIVGGHETVYSSDSIQKEPNKILPISFAFAVSPNPCVKQTRIDYALPTKTWVEIEIYDVSGRQVKTLVSESLNSGYYSTVWNSTDDRGRHVASGIYFIRFEGGELKTHDKVLLVR